MIRLGLYQRETVSTPVGVILKVVPRPTLLSTEIDPESTDLVIEAAHFSAEGIAKMARRHKLHSEASYRFERGVDRELPLYASAKASRMLAELGVFMARLPR